MPDHTLLEMLHRLWLVRDTDIAWEGAPEYDDIHLALIEAGLLEPPPPEPVRWGPVYGPKTRSQVALEAMVEYLTGNLDVLSPPYPTGFRLVTPKPVVFHRLPELSPDEGAH